MIILAQNQVHQKLALSSKVRAQTAHFGERQLKKARQGHEALEPRSASRKIPIMHASYFPSFVPWLCCLGSGLTIGSNFWTRVGCLSKHAIDHDVCHLPVHRSQVWSFQTLLELSLVSCALESLPHLVVFMCVFFQLTLSALIYVSFSEQHHHLFCQSKRIVLFICAHTFVAVIQSRVCYLNFPSWRLGAKSMYSRAPTSYRHVRHLDGDKVTNVLFPPDSIRLAVRARPFSAWMNGTSRPALVLRSFLCCAPIYTRFARDQCWCTFGHSIPFTYKYNMPESFILFYFRFNFNSFCLASNQMPR